MNSCLQHLDLIAAAPDGVKRLRELILELAVRGKLVPQDPNDEPASELLKRIQAEKARLVAEGKIRKDKPLPAIGEEEKPFDLPAGWTLSRLGDVLEIVRGITFPSSEKSKLPDFDRVACLRTANVQDQLEWEDLLFIKQSFVGREDQYLQTLDIVMSMANSRELVGKVALADSIPHPKATFGGFLGVLRPTLVDPRFVMVLLRTPKIRGELIDSASQTTNIANIGIGKLRPLLIALPPLPEQHRIVAKVDELMAMCERLEAQRTEGHQAHATLVKTLLDTLTQPNPPRESAAPRPDRFPKPGRSGADADPTPPAPAASAVGFTGPWSRVASHFDTLFTTEASIDALKQTILQLAVMGKLVPQNPDDEPASELLKRIQAEKDRLITDEGLRTSAFQTLPQNTEWLPSHWSYERLGNLAKFIDYRGRTPPKTQSGVPLITAKNVRFGFIAREPREFITDVEYVKWMTRGFPKVGDILFTTEAPLGNVALVDIKERFGLAQRVICLQLHEPQIGPFLKLAIMSKQLQMEIGEEATGMTATGIKASRLKEIPMPIPPLPEQHRIVAKVDELMALCDQLASQLKSAREVSGRYASAATAAALKAA